MQNILFNQPRWYILKRLTWQFSGQKTKVGLNWTNQKRGLWQTHIGLSKNGWCLRGALRAGRYAHPMIQGSVQKFHVFWGACLCVCTKQFSMCRYRLSIYFLDFVWFWWYYVDKITVTKVPNRIFKGMKLMAGGSIKIGYAKMGYQLHGVLGHLPFCSMFSQRT